MKFIRETGIFAILLTCGSIENCTTTVGKELPKKKSSENSNLLHCTIDDTIVSDEEFQHYLKSLKEIPNTWFCAETTTGGRTGYDATDWMGVIYEYRVISESGNNDCYIKKKENPH